MKRWDGELSTCELDLPTGRWETAAGESLIALKLIRRASVATTAHGYTLLVGVHCHVSSQNAFFHFFKLLMFLERQGLPALGTSIQHKCTCYAIHNDQPNSKLTMPVFAWAHGESPVHGPGDHRLAGAAHIITASMRCRSNATNYKVELQTWDMHANSYTTAAVPGACIWARQCAW